MRRPSLGCAWVAVLAVAASGPVARGAGDPARKAHPEYDWMRGLRKDMPARPWSKSSGATR